ncbi:MAG: 5'-methylthioadenosine/S-adenosylhomocysteine nucleosidase [Mycoplasmataceae bacterium]|jgi:adenosylhomocysteine nucleosidase|nr:5'-methylthioadenosine/S-adenosylhomocysteine nucleosidase [Mycoplasmataceae bacterium]
MIGFVIALSSETPTLLKKMTYVHTSVVNNHEVYILKFLDDYACLIYSGVGKVNAATATQILIDCFKTNIVINVGSCGSLVANLKVNDIVIPNIVGYYDVDVTAFGYGLNQVPKQPIDFLTTRELNEKILDIIKLYPNSLSHGKLVSGDTFINQKNINKFNFDEKAVAVDMESAAVIQTCSKNKISCAIIKVVSDSIFHSKQNNTDWNKNITDVGKLIDLIINDVAYFLIYNNQNKILKV